MFFPEQEKSSDEFYSAESGSHDDEHVGQQEEVVLPEIRDPKIHGTTNTGPKGVLNDYKIAKQKLLNKMIQRDIETIEQAKRNSFVVLSSPNDKEKDEEDILDEDDEFFNQWRDERMKQLQEQLGKNNQQFKKEEKNTANYQKIFGQYYRIGKSQYVDFIDSESESTYVVLHLYDNHNRDCTRLNSCLEDIAKKYNKIKFGHIIATEAKEDFDEFALPVLIIYKGGQDKPTKTLLRAHEFLDPNFDFDDVEQFLTDEQLLHPNLADPNFENN